MVVLSVAFVWMRSAVVGAAGFPGLLVTVEIQVQIRELDSATERKTSKSNEFNVATYGIR